jgi:general secretion pathway protein H
MARSLQVGFTLIEILVVLAIIALALGATIPAYSSIVDGARLRAAARDLANELRALRTAAIGRHEPVALSVAADGTGYRSPLHQTAVLLPSGATLAVVPRDLGAQPGRKAEIVFFEDGSSSGGEVVIRRTDAVHVIDIDWLVGRISIREQG